MSTGTAKMSLEASDVQTDEDCEELVEDSFSFSADISEKYPRTRRKRSSAKPPKSPRSPYLSSINVNPRRAAVAAWRLPRASLGDTRGDTPGDSGSACFTSLSNGHDTSQTLRSEFDITPELLRQTLGMRKHKHSHSVSNGFASSPGDYREKEDMYDEIIRLKKNLQAQKTDNQRIKVKLRRLEEDNAKREKQIEELLDPTKGSEYTRSLVDKKKEGSVVLNGLKQRILKLEQQCREKENSLSKLQSELRSTNLEELKITVETYFGEIQRLRMLFEASEKSSRAESKCSQRQQKALSSTVHRLSEKLKQLQQENTALREELNTDGPAGGLKGYREWSKQRLLRRLLEVEKRLEDSKRHAHSAKSGSRLDQWVQVTPTEDLVFTMATEAVVSVGTMTEDREEISVVREHLSQLEEERAGLHERLLSKDDEVRQLKKAREELEKDTEQWKTEQTKEQDEERLQHKRELEQLRSRIQTLEDKIKPAQAEPSSSSTTSPKNTVNAEAGVEKEEVRDAGGKEEEKGHEELGTDWRKRHKAAMVIQRNWRKHRKRDIVMLQSALRGHLVRKSQLKDLLKDAKNKPLQTAGATRVAPTVEGELDEVALTTIQSALRGHLTRCSLAIESSAFFPPPVSVNTQASKRACSAQPASRTGTASSHKDSKKQREAEDPRLTTNINSSRMAPKTDQTKLHSTVESGGAAAVDSDDSDDIIVSPSRPMRRREVLIS